MKAVSLLLTGLAALVLTAPAADAATGVDDEQYRRKYEVKLKKEFISFGGWITDYDEARAKAKKEGKVLFVYFSRSYAP